MKHVLFAAMGIVIGFVLGGIRPRMELAELQTELSETRAELADAEPQSRTRPSLPVPGMSEMLAPAEGRDDDPGSDADIDDAEDADPDEATQQADADEDEAVTADNLAEKFDLAVAAQTVRAAQSRAALQEQAGLSDEDMVEFDNIVEEMNMALAEYSDPLMDIALSGEEPEAEDMLGLTHEVTGILYDYQSAVNDLVGDDGMEETDPLARHVWNHIDLSVFEDSVADRQQ